MVRGQEQLLTSYHEPRTNSNIMNKQDIRIDYFRGSGPGGQHRNTSETGVRITHLPTGLVVTATESRSRHQNLQKAMARLEERLAARLRKRRTRIATRPSRSSIKKRLTKKRLQGDKKKQRGMVSSE